MTLRARKCKGCKALPLGKKQGVCLLGKNFITCRNETVPLGPSCSSKSTTLELFKLKLEQLHKEGSK